MLDRAHQGLVKLALEPEWEARFEANSYGFRPARSTHDAIAAIFNIICKQPKYVLDADIANCFNNIHHTALLETLHTSPALRRTIKAWLKAGVLEDGVFAATEAGPPQGGTISPLLAKVALHGMEQAVQAGATFKGRDKPKPKWVRYADDLVVFFPTREGIEKAKAVLETWFEIDHIIPRSQGGQDERRNLVALHRHCHDQRHAKMQGGGSHDKTFPTEEPDEGKALMSGSGGGQEGAIPLA
jgi:RNA-directed DNA polymerase